MFKWKIRGSPAMAYRVRGRGRGHGRGRVHRDLEDMDEVFIIILNKFSIGSNSYYNDY